jgi:glycerol-3-phosphate dehydrogenase (NAD(P)+)
MNVTILGAGAWGTALASQAAPRHAVQLWSRSRAQAEVLRNTRRNQRYLPDIALSPELVVADELAAALAHAADGLVVIATPMSGLRALLAAQHGAARVLWLCKGFEAGSGQLGHEIAVELRPQA